MNNFKWFRPDSLEEVLDSLAEYADDAKLMAGGQSLLLLMREGLVQPELVISLQNVPGLAGIEFIEGGGLNLGGGTLHRQIERSQEIKEAYLLLWEAYQNLGNVQVRNLATLGGNLCHNAPGSDPWAPLVALEAEVVLKRAGDELRRVSVEEFGSDYYETVIEDDELLVSVHVPPLDGRVGTAYQKVAVRPMDMAIAGAAVVLKLDESGERCEKARVALTGVNGRTVRAPGVEAALQGNALSESLIAEAAEQFGDELDPIDDVHASAEYRRRLAPVVVRRMVARAWQRGREE